jgi:hypothetical protein
MLLAMTSTSMMKSTSFTGDLLRGRKRNQIPRRTSSRAIPSTNQLHTQRRLRRLAALNFFAANAAVNRSETEMLSINGTAMQSTLRDFHRAAVGCPSMTGSWSRPVAKNYRHFGTELDR